jgi:hypothetical protein
MPHLTFAIVMGLGSVVAVFGLVLLLTVVTRTPRAKPTLLVRGREWRLRGLAILGLLAGGLCLGFPFVYGPAGPPYEPSEAADRSASHAHKPSVAPHHDQERHILDDQGRGHVVAGGLVAREPPGPRPPRASQGSPPHDPLNLTGEWTVTNTVVETSYAPYRDLRLGFRIVVQHDGPTFTGAGEKYLENGRKIPRAARRPIRIQGRVAAGAIIEATFQEDGHSRQIQGLFRLTMQDRQHLTGTFVSTAANTSGASQWLRPPPSPDQGAPPVLALVAPVQGQQVTTGRVQVRGTATGAPGIVRVDIRVNGEHRVQRAVHGEASVDFAEPIALRHGPNDIVVTAVDQQQRAARHRVTVTRVKERPQPLAPADEPREPIAAGRRTVQSPRPSLHLGMSQSEVRALLGEPVSIEDTAEFVFWNYGPEAYVVFERGAGHVHGWVGVSSGEDR